MESSSAAEEEEEEEGGGGGEEVTEVLEAEDIEELGAGSEGGNRRDLIGGFQTFHRGYLGN